MEPHLVRWHEKWSKQGLVVIEFDNGETDTLKDVEKHVAKAKVPYVFVHDVNGTITSRYKIEGSPAAYLLDKTGKVIWEGHPAGQEADLEKKIEAALAG